MGSSPTTTTVADVPEGTILPFQEYLDLFKNMNGEEGKVVIRLLPPVTGGKSSLYHHTRVHKIACPICEFMEQEQKEKKKRRFRSIDEPFEPSV